MGEGRNQVIRYFFNLFLKVATLIEFSMSGLSELRNKSTLVLEGKKRYVGSTLRNMVRTGIPSIFFPSFCVNPVDPIQLNSIQFYSHLFERNTIYFIARKNVKMQSNLFK